MIQDDHSSFKISIQLAQYIHIRIREEESSRSYSSDNGKKEMATGINISTTEKKERKG